MASISALMIQDGTPSVPSPTQENDQELQKSAMHHEPSQSSGSAPGSSQLATNMEVDDDRSMALTSQPENATTPTVAMNEKRLADSDEGQEHDDEDGEDKTDDEGDQTEGGSASRKKKGQRFFCTGYPPCNLSFTRSEHLARHIRKHTGERPFQCHCNRRFSRLDNLRQHAQTVHINEEIPGDSLAATGTRYQRQIRTDRVRPAPRPRTATMSSGSGHTRGHSRNLSTSSIGSTSSVYSNATDVRRRPPPLMMAGDNRPSTPPTYSHYAAQSPGDLSTPTSSTYPATPGSPNFSSTIGSPNSTASRPYGETRTPARRLSVPATYNPFYPYPNPSNSSYGPGPAVSTSVSSSIVTSPTSAHFPHQPGSTIGAYSGSDDWRRRTWHPSTYSNVNSYNRPATSSLTYSQTPDAPAPAYAHGAMSAAGQAPRLPGIESFDHVQHRPTTPPRRNLTPPQAANGQRLLAAPEIDGPRRGHTPHASWDGSKRSLYPDIDDNGRPTSDWGRQQASHGDPFRPVQPQQNPVQPPMGPPPHIGHQQSQQMAQQALHLESSAAKRVKRSGQYTGPGTNQRTSPDSSSSDGIPTPGTSAAEINPAIMNSNGYIEPQLLAGENQHTPCMAPFGSVLSPHESHYGPNRAMHPPRPRRASELDRLEALVAVATRETKR